MPDKQTGRCRRRLGRGRHLPSGHERRDPRALAPKRRLTDEISAKGSGSV